MPNLNVTYDDMKDAATKLTNGKHEIEDKLSALKALVDSLVSGGYVTDSSSKQFDTSYTEFHKGANSMIDGLDGMSGYLNAAADTFSQADQQLAKQLQSN